MSIPNGQQQLGELIDNCTSKAERIAIFMSLLKCLRLGCGYDLTLIVEDAADDAACPFPNNLHFDWNIARTEGEIDVVDLKNASHNALIEYLVHTAHYNAVACPNGEGLPGGLMYDVYVYPLKCDVRKRTGPSNLQPDQPRVRHSLMGRTGAAILEADRKSIIRMNICVAIEVKPEGFDVPAALREALLHLLGLNADNMNKSPSVVLTDLVQSHYVLYLDRLEIFKVNFKLVIKHYTAFNQAIYAAAAVGQRECVTRHLGSTPSPGPSRAGSRCGNALEYGNVSLEDGGSYYEDYRYSPPDSDLRCSAALF